MQKFVHDQAATLLDRLAFQANRAAKTADAEAIHDLRISIRRFSQCLRVFDGFFPKRPVKKMRKRMRRIMDLAAEVRNRDIALELLQKSGVQVGKPLLSQLAQERKQTKKNLVTEIKRWSDRNPSHKWRTKLGL